MHLERVICILEIVGQRGEATVAEICVYAELPKPSAYRLVQELVSVGLLAPSTRGQFMLGTRLKRITHTDFSDNALIKVIDPVLTQAATHHGAAFFLSRLRADRVEIIHVATPDTGVSYLHPGMGKRPLHACSCSKVIAAFSPELFSKQTLDRRMKRYTDNTITSLQDLETEFEAIRKRGYAECVEELERGICSVAAPLSATGPGATLSIGATASTRVLTTAVRQELGQNLIAIARDVSNALNWNKTAHHQKVG